MAGTTIGEVNINLRMSLAQFKTDVRQGTEEARNSVGKMGDEFKHQSTEAKHSLALIGEEIGVKIPRHIRGFITQLPAVATALSAAFSAIAVVALAEVVVKTIEKIQEMAKEIGGFGKEAEEAYKKFVAGNKEAIKFADDLKQKYRELGLIGLTGAAKDAKQRQIDIENLAEAQKKLTEGQKQQREVEKEIAALEAKRNFEMASGTRLATVFAEKTGIVSDKLPELKERLAALIHENKGLADAIKTVNYADLLNVLKVWKQTTQFFDPEDWVFASPVQIGRLPYSYTRVKQELQRAADAASLGHLRSHAFRHAYRTWLDSVGTPVGVQQRLMRHADIRTTMNIYGDVATPEMREAHGKIVGLALNGMGNGMGPGPSN